MICLLYDYLSFELDPEEEEIKVRQRRQSKKMSTSCFSRTRISENLDSFFFFCESISNSLFRSLFFPLAFFFIRGFVAHAIVFLAPNCVWLAF